MWSVHEVCSIARCMELQTHIFIVRSYIFDTEVILFQCLALRLPNMYQTTNAHLTRTLEHQKLCLLSMRVTAADSKTDKSLFNLQILRHWQRPMILSQSTCQTMVMQLLEINLSFSLLSSSLSCLFHYNSTMSE